MKNKFNCFQKGCQFDDSDILFDDVVIICPVCRNPIVEDPIIKFENELHLGKKSHWDELAEVYEAAN